MTSWNIGKRLNAGFGALLLLVALAVGGATWVASRLAGALDDTRAQTREIALSWKLSDRVTGLRGDQRDALLHPRDVSQAAFDRAAIDRQCDELSAALPNEDERREVENVRKVVHEWLAVNQEVIAAAVAGDQARALELADRKADPLIERAESLIGAMLVAHDAAVEATETHAESLKARAAVIQFAILLLAIGAGVTTFFVVRGVTRSLRGTTDLLRAGAQQVAAAAEQVATSAQSLSQGATEQAASLEETSASMEEVGSMTRLNADHSSQAATLMADVNQQVGRSNEALQAMVGSMASIQESSARVSKIIKTIDEIAFQTNILALNAAVEAARAGEAGMGFAVVADEVRTLAQRSAQAAKDTTALIEESSRNAQSGATTLDQVAGAIAAITTSVDKVKALVDQVSAASREQTHGTDQVAQAIAQMEKVTQSTAATAEESAAASEELNAQAEATMQAVDELTRLVGQAARRRGRPAAGQPAEPAVAARAKAPLHVVTARRSHGARPAATTAEQAIPLGDEGTFGHF